MAVTLINPFELPEGRQEEALMKWQAAAEHLRKHIVENFPHHPAFYRIIRE